ncbi:MAG: hypothetical protein AABW73_02495 [Nanoarchaeota archaeon]
MNTKELTDLVASYEYGQFNILHNGIKATSNRQTGQVKFYPFYNRGHTSTVGSCGELMNAAYKEIRRTYPNLHVIRTTGTEPEFFPGDNDTHCFLLVSNHNLMGPNHFSEHRSIIDSVTSSNPLVVDPSFKRVIPLADSGYGVKRIFNQTCRVGYSTDLLLCQGGGYVPLGISSKGDVVDLGVDFSNSNVVIIGVKKRGCEMEFYDLNSSGLRNAFSYDSRLEELVDLFRRVKLVETDRFLKTSTDSFVS